MHLSPCWRRADGRASGCTSPAALGLTFLRTCAALVLGALWTVPVGIWIGLSPRRVRVLQPVIQVAAAFPAPMLFPLVTLAILAAGVPFSWGCVVLMLLGSQWYILFNVLAGASAMPHDLREVADGLRPRPLGALAHALSAGGLPVPGHRPDHRRRRRVEREHRRRVRALPRRDADRARASAR